MRPERVLYLSHSPEARLKHIKDNPITQLRTTFAKIEERSSNLYALRTSFSSTSLGKKPHIQNTQFRMSNLNNQKKNCFQGLKETLDLLQGKIKNAKEQLVLPISIMKKKQKIFSLCDEDEIDITKPSQSTITLKSSHKNLSSVVTNIAKPQNFKPSYTNPYSPRHHSIYYVSEAMRAINQKNSLSVQHISGSIRIIKSCEVYRIPNKEQIESKKLNLKKKQFYKDKKTLVLDLDETLIHCVENQYSQSDLKLKFKVDQADITVGINIRPYAISFLKKMAKKFQIIIFTASHHSYADAILNQLDPEGQIFQHRLYRHHCYILDNQWHVKDLRIINRDLSDMVLVDNAAYSYAFQLQNGIPILPYYEGSDFELAALESYLLEMERMPDVRQVNKKTFKLHHYSKFYSSEELIEQLYINNFQ